MTKKKIKEGVVGSMQEITFTPPERELSDFDKWMKIVNEAEEENMDEEEAESEDAIEEASDEEEEVDEKEEIDESQKLDEGIVGGMQGIVPTFVDNSEDEFSKWMNIVSEGETGNKKLTECPESLVQGDYSNGYGNQHKTSAAYSDFFPNGADSNVVSHVGPSSAEQGDNPMQKAIKDNQKDDITEAFEKEKVHKDLVSAYRTFLANAEKEHKEFNSRLDKLEKGIK